MAREIGDRDLNKQQKFRAFRVDHTYYKKPHPWRSWMRGLSFVLPIVGLGVLGFATLFPAGSNMYMPGPVTTKHQIFAERCNECHEEVKDKTGKLVFGQVTDAKCSHCHDGPIHHENQKYPYHIEAIAVDGKGVKYEAPGCATCHTEHASNTRLTEIADRHCTQCHINLEVKPSDKQPKPIYATGIAGFNSGHPEFAAKRPDTKDNAQIRFNHAKHLGPDSTVKKESGSKLDCVDCHKPDAQRAYMAPVTYAVNCKGCHPIQIPPVANIGKVELPHAEAAVVSAVAKTAFGDYLLKNGGKPPAVIDPHIKELEDQVAGERNPAKKKKLQAELEKAKAEGGSKPDPRTPEQWQKENVAATLKPLFFPDPSKEGASCFLCHISEGKDEANDLPKVAPTKIPAIWFKHAKFNHETHRVLKCDGCHNAAITSSKTEDVLLPGIQNCQTCHLPSGARSGCNECHVYHDKSHPKVEGVLLLDELRTGTQNKPVLNAPPSKAPASAPASSEPAASADKAAPAPAPAQPAAEPKPDAPAPAK
jgi:hypothetical protein